MNAVLAGMQKALQASAGETSPFGSAQADNVATSPDTAATVGAAAAEAVAGAASAAREAVQSDARIETGAFARGTHVRQQETAVDPQFKRGAARKIIASGAQGTAPVVLQQADGNMLGAARQTEIIMEDKVKIGGADDAQSGAWSGGLTRGSAVVAEAAALQRGDAAESRDKATGASLSSAREEVAAPEHVVEEATSPEQAPFGERGHAMAGEDAASPAHAAAVAPIDRGTRVTAEDDAAASAAATAVPIERGGGGARVAPAGGVALERGVSQGVTKYADTGKSRAGRRTTHKHAGSGDVDVILAKVSAESVPLELKMEDVYEWGIGHVSMEVDVSVVLSLLDHYEHTLSPAQFVNACKDIRMKCAEKVVNEGDNKAILEALFLAVKKSSLSQTKALAEVIDDYTTWKNASRASSLVGTATDTPEASTPTADETSSVAAIAAAAAAAGTSQASKKGDDADIMKKLANAADQGVTYRDSDRKEVKTWGRGVNRAREFLSKLGKALQQGDVVLAGLERCISHLAIGFLFGPVGAKKWDMSVTEFVPISAKMVKDERGQTRLDLGAKALSEFRATVQLGWERDVRLVPLAFYYVGPSEHCDLVAREMSLIKVDKTQVMSFLHVPVDTKGKGKVRDSYSVGQESMRGYAV